MFDAFAQYLSRWFRLEGLSTRDPHGGRPPSHNRWPGGLNTAGDQRLVNVTALLSPLVEDIVPRIAAAPSWVRVKVSGE